MGNILENIWHVLGNCYGELIQKYDQKLCSIILLHSGLESFRCVYGRDRKLLMLMISGFMDVSLSPKPILFFRDSRRLQQIQETRNPFQKYDCWKYQTVGIRFRLFKVGSTDKSRRAV